MPPDQMLAEEDKTKLISLLTNAVVVLCRSGVTGSSVQQVEGLLGITLHTNEVFLINIKESLDAREGELVGARAVEKTAKVMSSPKREVAAHSRLRVCTDQRPSAEVGTHLSDVVGGSAGTEDSNISNLNISTNGSVESASINMSSASQSSYVMTLKNTMFGPMWGPQKVATGPALKSVNQVGHPRGGISQSIKLESSNNTIAGGELVQSHVQPSIPRGSTMPFTGVPKSRKKRRKPEQVFRKRRPSHLSVQKNITVTNGSVIAANGFGHEPQLQRLGILSVDMPSPVACLKSKEVGKTTQNMDNTPGSITAIDVPKHKGALNREHHEAPSGKSAQLEATLAGRLPLEEATKLGTVDEASLDNEDLLDTDLPLEDPSTALGFPELGAMIKEEPSSDGEEEVSSMPQSTSLPYESTTTSEGQTPGQGMLLSFPLVSPSVAPHMPWHLPVHSTSAVVSQGQMTNPGERHAVNDDHGLHPQDSFHTMDASSYGDIEQDRSKHSPESFHSKAVKSGFVGTKVQLVDGKKVLMFYCLKCSYSTRWKSNFHRHIRKHTGQMFICPYENCTLKFQTNYHLQKHVLWHTTGGVKCEVCGRSFRALAALTKHKRMHKS